MKAQKKTPSEATLRAKGIKMKRYTHSIHKAHKKSNHLGLTVAVSALIGAGIWFVTTPVAAAPELPEDPYIYVYFDENGDPAEELAQGSQGESFYPLEDAERELIEAVLMSECPYEPYAGQVAVAQCILDGCEYLGIRPEECIRVYQYAEPSEAEPTQSVQDAVSAVFDEGYRAAEEDILFFYAPKYCSSPFHESQRFVMEIGGHRFFAMR